MSESETLNHYLKSKCFYKKNVLITGATGGIGSKVLKKLLSCEANVVALIRDKNKLQDYLNDYIEKGVFQFEIIDLLMGMKITDVFKKAMTKLGGKLDILILCHGSFTFGNLEDVKIKEFDENINLNVRANVHLLSLSVPFLKLTKGNVVMISSLESNIVERGDFLQSISKNMINSLVQNSALELASFGIRVNAVAPCFVNTKLRVGEKLTEDKNTEYLQQMKGYCLLKDISTPDDISDAILFLASDEANFMTGEIMTIDSGFELNHDLSFQATEY